MNLKGGGQVYMLVWGSAAETQEIECLINCSQWESPLGSGEHWWHQEGKLGMTV